MPRRLGFCCIRSHGSWSRSLPMIKYVFACDPTHRMTFCACCISEGSCTGCFLQRLYFAWKASSLPVELPRPFLHSQVSSFTQKMSATSAAPALQYKVTRPAIVAAVRQRFNVSKVCSVSTSALAALWQCPVVLEECNPPQNGSEHSLNACR